jgi:hypothetical protein
VFTARYGLSVYVKVKLILVPKYNFIFILLLLEGRAGETWEISN